MVGLSELQWARCGYARSTIFSSTTHRTAHVLPSGASPCFVGEWTLVTGDNRTVIDFFNFSLNRDSIYKPITALLPNYKQHTSDTHISCTNYLSKRFPTSLKTDKACFNWERWAHICKCCERTMLYCLCTCLVSKAIMQNELFYWMFSLHSRTDIFMLSISSVFNIITTKNTVFNNYNFCLHLNTISLRDG